MDEQSNSVNSGDTDQSTTDSNGNIVAFWEYEQTFANQAAFDHFLAEEKCWSLLKTGNLKKGNKTTWRCNKVKRRGKQCIAGVYTLQVPESEQIQLFRRRAAHSCDASDNQSKKKVPEDVRNFIIEQYKLGNPPATIVFKLRERTDITQPTKEQVTHVNNYYKEKTPNTTVSIADMETFVQQHNTVPDDDDDPFVVNFECSAPRSDDKLFRLFFSTKRLLKHALLSNIRHSDGTYQTMVEGYPMLTLGVSDADKHFHLSGLAITSSETTAAYKFLFDSLQHGVKISSDENLRAETLVADMATAITEGYAQSFENATFTRIHCFTHVMTNVEKQKFREATNKESIKADIRRLQLIHSADLFHEGWKLMAAKWVNREPDFIAYFEKVYIKTNPNWYEGAADRTPKTNNCLEVFHRLMKDQQTMHLRKPLNQILPLALSIVRDRSKSYIQDKNIPTTSVTIRMLSRRNIFILKIHQMASRCSMRLLEKKWKN